MNLIIVLPTIIVFIFGVIKFGLVKEFEGIGATINSSLINNILLILSILIKIISLAIVPVFYVKYDRLVYESINGE